MKIKKVYLIATVLFLAGLFLLFTSLALVGFNIRKFNTSPPYTTKSTTIEGTIHSIQLTGSTNDVQVIPSNDQNIHLQYPENSIEHYEITRLNDTLTIVQKNTGNWYQNTIHLDFGEDSHSVQLALPSNYNGQISIATANGDIDLNGISSQNPINLHSNFGDLSVNNVNATDMSTTTDNGDIDLSNLKISSKLNLSSSFGDISMDQITAPDISATTNNGDIDTDSLAIGKTLTLTSSFGDIGGNLLGSEQDYSIRSKTYFGDNNLDNSTGHGKDLLVQTNNGDIDLDFVP